MRVSSHVNMNTRHVVIELENLLSNGTLTLFAANKWAYKNAVCLNYLEHPYNVSLCFHP